MLWAKGHFKDYEASAKCIVLLIVLCLWEGGVLNHIFVAKVFALLRSHFGKIRTFWVYTPQK